jgi:5'-3' exonuclease
MSEEPELYLLDVHYLIFRAYHALPELLGPDGAPVGAVRGYLQTILRLLRRLDPRYIAAAADFRLTSFRNELHPGYKQGRTQAPPDLEPQFAICARATRGLGIPYYELEGFEADDVIATLVRLLAPSGVPMCIVTRDKDLSALVGSRVTLMDPGGGGRVDEAAVQARFGVPPRLVSELLALSGDGVDRIPGVRGVGPSTARALLRHFGAIDRISLDARDWNGIALRNPDRVRECLASGRRDLELSRELARLRDDLPLEVELEDLRYRGADRTVLGPLLARHGLAGLLRRVPRWRP